MIERIDQQTAATQAQAVTAATAVKPAAGATDAAPAAAAGELNIPYPTDRVEISEQGLAEAAQSQAADSASQAVAQMAAKADTDDTEAAAEAVAKATEQASSNTNLTSLSEQQIEALVKEGSVSRAQADAELASRQGE